MLTSHRNWLVVPPVAVSCLMVALHLHSRTPEDELLVPDRIHDRLTDTS
jgi:hypothetical protein